MLGVLLSAACFPALFLLFYSREIIAKLYCVSLLIDAFSKSVSFRLCGLAKRGGLLGDTFSRVVFYVEGLVKILSDEAGAPAIKLLKNLLVPMEAVY